MAKFEPILLKNRGVEGIRTLKTYRERGGYAQAEKALKNYKPDEIVEIVKCSNLRGRGGA